MTLAAMIRRLAAHLDPLYRHADQPAAEPTWMDDQESRLRQLEDKAHEHRAVVVRLRQNIKRRSFD